MRICRKCGRGEFTYLMMRKHVELCYGENDPQKWKSRVSYGSEEGSGIHDYLLEF